MSKADLFDAVIESESMFLFGELRFGLACRKNEGASDGKYSLKPYSYLVDEASRTVREEFGDHVDKLNVNGLEWLTILLSVWPFNPCKLVHDRRSKWSGLFSYFCCLFTSCGQYLGLLNGRNSRGDIENPNAPSLNSERAETSSTRTTPGVDEKLYSDEEIPVLNLRTQLGLENIDA